MVDEQLELARLLHGEIGWLGSDLLVAVGTAQVRAAKDATSAIPILMVGGHRSR